MSGVAPKCKGCRIPKAMQRAGVVCGPFMWRANFCQTCTDTEFDRFMHGVGFALTQFMFNGTVILLPVEVDG